jgi:hypothetical protein
MYATHQNSTALFVGFSSVFYINNFHGNLIASQTFDVTQQMLFKRNGCKANPLLFAQCGPKYELKVIQCPSPFLGQNAARYSGKSLHTHAGRRKVTSTDVLHSSAQCKPFTIVSYSEEGLRHWSASG